MKNDPHKSSDKGKSLKKGKTAKIGTTSLWMQYALPKFPPLKEGTSADVCIVGGGIAGLMAAYTLAKAGKSVIVIDKKDIGLGETSRTTAHVTWVLDERYHALLSLFGKEKVSLVACSHRTAIDDIEKIVLEENISCDWLRTDGYLFASTVKGKEGLIQELGALQDLGQDVHKLKKAPIEAFETGFCLHFPRQGCLHILKFIDGLTKAIQKYGGKLFSHTTALDFQDGSPCKVKVKGHLSVTAKAILVATNTPINNRYKIHTKQAPYRTYVIGASVPKGTIGKGLYWDLKDPYHYIRLQEDETDPEKEWLLIGGADHKTGQAKNTEDKFSSLEKWAKKHFPMIQEIAYHWSGQVFEPVDVLAFIGRNPGDKNIYIATGFSGNGITYGAISGRLISDLIMGHSNPLESIYNPSRITWRAAPEFIRENSNVAWQYTDWLTPGEKKTIKKLQPGEGAILRRGLKKIAAYKDAEDKVHIHSACCPHLGGCVHWNSSEKSWDCPCHGSRFDGCGKVIMGPAIGNLRKI